MAGELAQFNALRSFPVWNKYEVSADGTPAGLGGACVVYGIYCITAGTIAGMYDYGGSASGPNYAVAIALTARQKIEFAGGRGVLFAAGVYLDITGGTYLVLAAPGG